MCGHIQPNAFILTRWTEQLTALWRALENIARVADFALLSGRVAAAATTEHLSVTSELASLMRKAC